MRFNVFRGCRHVKSINLASVKAVSRCDFPDVQVNFAHLNKIMSVIFHFACLQNVDWAINLNHKL